EMHVLRTGRDLDRRLILAGSAGDFDQMGSRTRLQLDFRSRPDRFSVEEPLRLVRDHQTVRAVENGGEKDVRSEAGDGVRDDFDGAALLADDQRRDDPRRARLVRERATRQQSEETYGEGEDAFRVKDAQTGDGAPVRRRIRERE